MEHPPLSSFLHPRHWPTWIGVGLLRLLAYLPLPVLHVLGAGLGELVCLLYRSRRAIALRNIERCFPALPAARQRRLVRRNFRETAQSILSTGISWWAPHRRLQRLVRTRDRRHYDQALAAGQPVILLAPHFVAMELGGIFVSSELSAISMYQKSKNPLLDEIVRRGRSRFGGIMVERKSDMRTLIRQLRAGKPFYYLPDQDPGPRRGVFAPFFGIATATVPALSRFARVARATVLPCYTRQLPRGHGYEIIFGPPLAEFPSGDEAADAGRMNAAIEHGVRMMPEQYFWVHKRFKTRPAGEPEFYA